MNNKGGTLLQIFPAGKTGHVMFKQARLLVLLLFAVLLVACKTELHSGLDENEANNMVSVLVNNGVDAEKGRDKKGGKFTILVERSQISVAVDTLRQHGLPRERFSRVDDIFKKDGLISSPLEERVRYIYALSEQVEETLSQIDGVVTSRVHVVLPENNPFSDGVKPSSASVFIKYLPDSQLNEIKSEIKFIVEKSIEGLSYDKVSLVMLPAKSAYSSTGESQWTSLLGIRILKSQVGIFRLIIWGLVASLAMLFAIVVFLLVRQVEQDNEEGMAEKQPAPAGGRNRAASAGSSMMRKITKLGRK
jgi:type III secretion protein J